MLIAKVHPDAVQRISMLIKRRRPTFGGSGIFYHTPLRRTALVPISNTFDEEQRNTMLYNLGLAGLSSQIGTQFDVVPPGYREAYLFSILGSVENSPKIKVHNLENDDIALIDPNTLPVVFEILDEDLYLLQKQNQNALMLECEGFIQQNHQNYGEGFDADGRDRNLLKGSLWVTPVNYTIEFYRPQLRTAAGSAEEIYENTESAKMRAADRAVKATAESWANRDSAERYRAEQPIPQRRGSNQVLQIGRTPFGRETPSPERDNNIINL
jgi:hypothetical protein